MRVRNVAAAITRMPISGPWASGSLIIDKGSEDAAGERADHDEPPPRYQVGHDQRNDTRNRPADRTPRPAPQRHEHRGEKDRQHEVEAEPLGVSDEGAQQIAGDG